MGSPIRVKEVYALREWIEQHADLPVFKHIEPTGISPKELGRISNMRSPNQVLALCHIPEYDLEDEKSEDLQLVLDGIRDPGNMGTIIRTADWFGLGKVICSEDCVDVYNPKVVQSSMGSIARVKVLYTGLDEYLSGSVHDIYATVLDGTSIFDTNPGKGIYLIGNESTGLRPEVLKHATHRISIPSLGRAESLNASVATGIILAVARKI
jgi:TrmH family RNA methyltransferase